jgi:opine dehydrogenase
MKTPIFAVLGAGAGGLAMAADLTLAGFDVGLYELPEFEGRVEAIKHRQGIDATGAVRGHAALARVSCEAAEIIPQAQVVMTAIPAYCHELFIKRCLPYLKDGQVLVFNTGYYAALRFRETLKKAGRAGVLLAETMILPYTSRVTGPAQVHVDGKKRELTVAALPASRTDELLAMLTGAYPGFKAAGSVLETSLNNLNLMGHVPITLLNRARVERSTRFVISVRDAVSPSVARLMEAVSLERVALGKALGVEVMSILQILEMWGYAARCGTVYEAFQSSAQFSTFEYQYVGGSNQYLTEDLSFGLVPTASLAGQVGVQMPITRGLVDIFGTIDRTNYWKEGVKVEELGLSGSSASDIVRLVKQGWEMPMNPDRLAPAASP